MWRATHIAHRNRIVFFSSQEHMLPIEHSISYFNTIIILLMTIAVVTTLLKFQYFLNISCKHDWFIPLNSFECLNKTDCTEWLWKCSPCKWMVFFLNHQILSYSPLKCFSSGTFQMHRKFERKKGNQMCTHYRRIIYWIVDLCSHKDAPCCWFTNDKAKNTIIDLMICLRLFRISSSLPCWRFNEESKNKWMPFVFVCVCVCLCEQQKRKLLTNAKIVIVSQHPREWSTQWRKWYS